VEPAAGRFFCAVKSSRSLKALLRAGPIKLAIPAGFFIGNSTEHMKQAFAWLALLLPYTADLITIMQGLRDLLPPIPRRPRRERISSDELLELESPEGWKITYRKKHSVSRDG